MDYIKTKLSIYEAYEDGYITESEKTELIDILETSKDGESDDVEAKRNKMLKIALMGSAAIAACIAIAIAVNKSSEDKDINKEIAKLKNVQSNYTHFVKKLKNPNCTRDDIKTFEHELEGLMRVWNIDITNYKFYARDHASVSQNKRVTAIMNKLEKSYEDYKKFDNNRRMSEMSVNHPR